jgi:hypothetical protein
VGGGFSPADLQSAYKLPTSGGAGQTVAIVDAFDDPTAESDLNVYREHYGLSPCTAANGCFGKIDQAGGTAYPSSNTGWAQEISIDLDMVSAACPNCKILLVEATDNSFGNLTTAVNAAAAFGATEISNSWLGEEFSGEESFDPAFRHPGIPITVASGDHGYGPSFPASSKYVISVGGTSLSPAGNSRGWSEEAWGGTGGGCSLYEEKPTWQVDSGCAGRTENDVAAVANPETPVSIYDSFNSPGWMFFGGTSVATPIVAAAEALSDGYSRSLAAGTFYQNPTNLFDIVSGSNGACSPAYLCQAVGGYDGPTGFGTPDGPPHAQPAQAAALVDSAGNQFVYFRGADGALWQEEWSEGKGAWTLTRLGGEIPGNPTALLEKGGNRYVYVRGYDGALYQWFWNAGTSAWSLSKLGGGSKGEPKALLEGNGNRYVYVRGDDGALYQWFWNASTNAWSLSKVGGEFAGTPAPLSEGEGKRSVYVRGNNGVIYRFLWSGSPGSWSLHELGGVAAGNPIALLRANGAPSVFYRGTNDAISQVWFNPANNSWNAQELGGSATGDPSVVLEANGIENAAYRGSDGALWQWWWNPSNGSWNDQRFGGQPAGNPTAILQGSGNPDIYFLDESAGLSQWFFFSKSWLTSRICGPACGS